MTPSEAEKIVKEYSPKILIIGVREGGKVESVLCCSKREYFDTVGEFVSYRTFILWEIKNVEP